MSQFRLLSDKRFYPIFWTQFLTAFNDNFLKNALVILITFRSASVLGVPPAQMVALAGGIFILPFFVFSATAGQLADRFEKSRIIRVVKQAELAIMALAAWGLVADIPEALLGALFLMGVHSAFFGPIKYSILPQHLPESELLAANALVEAGTFLSILLGTIAGGALVAIPGSGPAIVAAGLVAVAVAGWGISLLVPAAPPVAPDLRVQWNPIPPTREIIRHTRGNPSVHASIRAISWFWFYGAVLLSVFPSWCKDSLGADSSVVTLFLACFSIGIGLGSLLCSRLSRGRLSLKFVPIGAAGVTFFLLALSLAHAPSTPAGPLDWISLFFMGAPSAPAASLDWLAFLRDPAGARIVVALVLLSVFGGIYIVPLYTVMQERAEPAHRSRVIATNNIVNALWIVAASVLLMALLKLGLSIPQIFAVLAVLNAVAFTRVLRLK